MGTLGVHIRRPSSAACRRTPFARRDGRPISCDAPSHDEAFRNEKNPGGGQLAIDALAGAKFFTRPQSTPPDCGCSPFGARRFGPRDWTWLGTTDGISAGQSEKGFGDRKGPAARGGIGKPLCFGAAPNFGVRGFARLSQTPEQPLGRMKAGSL